MYAIKVTKINNKQTFIGNFKEMLVVNSINMSERQKDVSEDYENILMNICNASSNVLSGMERRVF